MKIFAITLLQDAKPDNKFGAIFGDVHSVGWFSTMQAAEQELQRNSEWYWQHMYQYAVIEEYDEGTFKPVTNRKIFVYLPDSKIYQPIGEPAGMQHITNFAFG